MTVCQHPVDVNPMEPLDPPQPEKAGVSQAHGARMMFPTVKSSMLVDTRPVLSQQAQGGRLTAPADRAFPYRCVVMQEDHRGWMVLCIFEMRTDTEADEAGLEMCTEPYDVGVTAMHYYVGEVA